MIIILILLLLSPIISQAYEQVWATNFPNEEGYGYYGDELYLPTNEWSIDLRGISLTETLNPDWFWVNKGVLEGIDFDCSKQLDAENIGVLWKSKVIALDRTKSYYVNICLGTTTTWEISNLASSDFVRIGYYNDNQEFILIYEKTGVTAKTNLISTISNTSQCQLVIEVDCDADNEVFTLYSVNLYYDTEFGDSSDLIITKLCSPDNFDYNSKYIQITNSSNHIIDLSPFILEAIHNNSTLFSWQLAGFIAPYQSMIIGDYDTTLFCCNIGDYSWSSRNPVWSGISSNNDGAQIIKKDSKEVTDRVVGVNFYQGYTIRKPIFLLASQVTDSSSWDYYPVSSSLDSHPGEYLMDETLPISLLNTEFSWDNSTYYFHWTTFGETSLIGYNLYYAEEAHLTNSLKINPQIIMAHNSVQYNCYSFSLAEVESAGYLWLEVISLNEANSFSQAIKFDLNHESTQDAIELIENPMITVFPNPTSSESFLKVRNIDNPISEIAIYNLKGQLVGSTKPKNVSKNYDIHNITDKLPSGIYIIQTKINSHTFTNKLVVTK